MFSLCLPFSLNAAGTGYGSQNTGSATETAKSYIPGTDANRESRAAHGQDPNYGSSGNQGYGSSNTGRNTGSGVASYVPGTEANRESRAAHGQDPNRYTGSGSNQGYGSNTASGIDLNSCTVCMQAIMHATQVTYFLWWGFVYQMILEQCCCMTVFCVSHCLKANESTRLKHRSVCQSWPGALQSGVNVFRATAWITRGASFLTKRTWFCP